MQAARARDLGQALLQHGDALAHAAAVDLELGLAGSAVADHAAGLARQMRPLAGEARQQVLELRQLDLELARLRGRPLREDVEDQLGAVDDAHAEWPSRDCAAVRATARRRRSTMVPAASFTCSRTSSILPEPMSVPELSLRRLDGSADDGGAGGLAEAFQLVQRLLGIEQGVAAVLHGDENGSITGLRDVDHSSLTIAEGTPPVKPSVRTRVCDTRPRGARTRQSRRGQGCRPSRERPETRGAARPSTAAPLERALP